MIYQLNDQQRLLIERLNYLQINHPEQVAITVGKTIADKVMVPSEPVTDTESYFMDVVTPQANELLAKLFALLFFNLDDAESMIRKFWFTRYQLIHQTTAYSDYHNDAFLALLGIGHHLSIEDIALIRRSDELPKLCGGLMGLLGKGS